MTRPSRLILARRFAETLVFAVAGGAALGLPGLPAGWLSGAILFVAAAALAKRPVYVPQSLARVTFVVLGISLGAAVTPDVVSRIATWPVSMLMLALAMSCSTLCVAVYLNRVHGWDSMSSLFAAAPGALSQALALAADTSADLRSVAIVQSVRVLVLAVVLPLSSRGLAWPARRPRPLPMPPLRESLGELASARDRVDGGGADRLSHAAAGRVDRRRDADLGHSARHRRRALQPAAGGHHRLIRGARRDDRLALCRHRSRPPAAALHRVVRRAAGRDDGRRTVRGGDGLRALSEFRRRADRLCAGRARGHDHSRLRAQSRSGLCRRASPVAVLLCVGDDAGRGRLSRAAAAVSEKAEK